MRAVGAVLLAGAVVLAGACGPSTTAPTPIAPTLAPTVAPSPGTDRPAPALGWRRHWMPNLGLTIDLPTSWRPALELGAVELRDVTRGDMAIGAELDRWIHTSTRFEVGGDMGLVAVDPESLAIVRIGAILDPDPDLDAVALGRALFGEDEGVVIASASALTIAGGNGARLEGDRPDGIDTTHHLWFPFIGPSGEWIELGANVDADREGSFDATIDAAVATLVEIGEPAGHVHRSMPDSELARRLPDTLADRDLQVLTGDRAELEYAGVWDAWRAIFGSMFDRLPALQSIDDGVRFGVAFSPPADDGSSIEIYALRAPGIEADEWRPFLDGLPQQGWLATDPAGMTFANDDDVLGVRGETIYFLRGTPDLVAQAAAQLLP